MTKKTEALVLALLEDLGHMFPSALDDPATENRGPEALVLAGQLLGDRGIGSGAQRVGEEGHAVLRGPLPRDGGRGSQTRCRLAQKKKRERDPPRFCCYYYYYPDGALMCFIWKNTALRGCPCQRRPLVQTDFTDSNQTASDRLLHLASDRRNPIVFDPTERVTQLASWLLVWWCRPHFGKNGGELYESGRLVNPGQHSMDTFWDPSLMFGGLYI